MDWTATISELTVTFGMSQPEIAAFCKCRQPTISDLARGITKDPRDSIGQALRLLLTAKRAEAAAKAKAAADPAPGAQPGDAPPVARQRSNFEERPATAT